MRQPRFLKSIFSVAVGTLAAGTLFFATATDGHAAFKLKLTSNIVGGSQTIIDQGVGDNDPTLGLISFSSFVSGDVGGFNVFLTVGTSKPQIGSPTDPTMELVSIQANNSSGVFDTLTLELTDTGFTGPTPTGTFNTSLSGLLGVGAVTLTAFVDNTDAEFGQPAAGQISDIGPLTASQSGTDQTIAGTVNPFSLTMVAFINHSAVLGQTTFTSNLTTEPYALAIPEPTALSLFGIGLLGLGLLWRGRIGGKARG